MPLITQPSIPGATRITGLKSTVYTNRIMTDRVYPIYPLALRQLAHTQIILREREDGIRVNLFPRLK